MGSLLVPVLGSFLAGSSVKGADPTDTFYGTGALGKVTIGVHDSAFGYHALSYNTAGSLNTATGVAALYSNTTGNSNTANGFDALQQHHRRQQHGQRGERAL